MLLFFLFNIHYPSQKVTIIYKQKHSLVREKMSTHCNLEVVSFSLPPHNQYTHYGFCDLGPLYTFFLSVKCVFHTVLWWNDQYTTVNFNQSLTVLASPDCPNRQLPQIFFWLKTWILTQIPPSQTSIKRFPTSISFTTRHNNPQYALQSENDTTPFMSSEYRSSQNLSIQLDQL